MHFDQHYKCVCHIFCVDLHRFSKVSFSPYTGHILTEKKTNVPISRVFTCSGAEFKWASILSKLQDVCQNVLHCPYICKTSLNEVNTLHTHGYVCNPVHMSCSSYTCLFVKEISDLQVGKSVVVQTNRSNQIAFLRRLPDENCIPTVQVFIYLYAKQKHPGCETKQKQ